jgi:teichuronic acid biosynthesis glycosyltransferase TuaC
VRVTVVAEYYPRPDDPVSGVWAHRQALAARDAGADVRVLVLDRPVPGTAAVKEAVRGRAGRLVGALRSAAVRPRATTLDGIEVEYVRYLSPPRSRSYAQWHRWARRPLARALARGQKPDLVHAHYAHLAAAAALPWTEPHGVPLVVSVHGGDVIVPELRTVSAATLRSAAVVMCNSRGTLERAARLAGRDDHMRVVHLGTDIPAELPAKHQHPTIATVANVDPRKRHEDVLAALAMLPTDYRWTVIGDGTDLSRLRRLTAEHGLSERVTFTGRIPPHEAHAELAKAHVMALPSEDEAFGVAYIESLAHGVPAIGLAGESGPEEIAALAGESGPGATATLAGESGPGATAAPTGGGGPGATATPTGESGPGATGESGPEEIAAPTGGGEPGKIPALAGDSGGNPMLLVPARDPAALAEAIERAAGDAGLPERAREAARAHFTWERCGTATVAAYDAALRA